MSDRFIDTRLLIGGIADGRRVSTDRALNSLAVEAAGLGDGQRREIFYYRRELIAGGKSVFMVWVDSNCSPDDVLTKLFARYPQENADGR